MNHPKKIWTGPAMNPKPIIYLGGIIAARGARGGEEALRLYPTAVKYQCVSYFYFCPQRMDPTNADGHWKDFKKHGTRAFLDSGAFSYQMESIKKKQPLNQKAAEVVIDQYVDWVYACPFVFDFIVTFDYVRDPVIAEWATRRIEIGGMVGSSNSKLYPFLDQVFNITTKHNTKLHGFGIGSAVTMFKYPWFCVDSTTWLAIAGKRGSILQRSRNPRKIVDVVPVSSRSAAVAMVNGDSREERIRLTWLCYDSLMSNPPAPPPVKRGLF